MIELKCATLKMIELEIQVKLPIADFCFSDGVYRHLKRLLTSVYRHLKGLQKKSYCDQELRDLLEKVQSLISEG